ncbi:hypothetical protein ACET3Z_023052 [Daucus carota]
MAPSSRKNGWGLGTYFTIKKGLRGSIFLGKAAKTEKLCDYSVPSLYFGCFNLVGLHKRNRTGLGFLL